jgi:hypothetical protein
MVSSDWVFVGISPKGDKVESNAPGMNKQRQDDEVAQ